MSFNLFGEQQTVGSDCPAGTIDDELKQIDAALKRAEQQRQARALGAGTTCEYIDVAKLTERRRTLMLIKNSIDQKKC